MIVCKTLEMAEPKPEILTGYKQYASIPDDSRDAVLLTLLKGAIKAVQEYSDKTIVPSVYEVTESGREDNSPVKLYGYPSEIIEVTDGKGQALEFTFEASEVRPHRFTTAVRVRYKGAPALVESLSLLPVIYRYATALYDGAESATLNAILQESLC